MSQDGDHVPGRRPPRGERGEAPRGPLTPPLGHQRDLGAEESSQTEKQTGQVEGGQGAHRNTSILLVEGQEISNTEVSPRTPWEETKFLCPKGYGMQDTKYFSFPYCVKQS